MEAVSIEVSSRLFSMSGTGPISYKVFVKEPKQTSCPGEVDSGEDEMYLILVSVIRYIERLTRKDALTES